MVAAAVILPSSWLDKGLPEGLLGLNDSKQLTAAQRDRFFEVITTRTEIHYAIAQADASTIDAINILQATHRAMNEALARLNPSPQHALVDGTRVKSLRFPQTPLVKGDARSYSIAAASVLAKVTRDRQILEFHRQWPAYGWRSKKAMAPRGTWPPLPRTAPAPSTGAASRR